MAKEPSRITVTHAARNFADVVNRAYYRGESFVLTRSGKLVATLGPAPGVRVVTAAALSKRLDLIPRLSPEEAASFAADVDEARDMFPAADERDAWD